MDLIRSSRPDVFRKKGILRNFAKFIGKHLRQSLFFNKAAGLQLYQKQALAQVLHVNFAKISKSIFFYRTPLVAASV